MGFIHVKNDFIANKTLRLSKQLFRLVINFLYISKMHYKIGKDKFSRNRKNHHRAREEKSPVIQLTIILAACELYEECKTGVEINENCWHEKLISYLTENYGDNFLGNENPFELMIQNVNEIMNFQIENFTMTILRLRETITDNLEQFREDFAMERFFRIRDIGMDKCYVILSRLNLFWVTSSYDNFLAGSKKIKLINGKSTGTFIWVWLKKS